MELETIKEVKSDKEQPKDECSCGEISDYGVHGFTDGEMYSFYYCKSCYLKKKS